MKFSRVQGFPKDLPNDECKWPGLPFPWGASSPLPSPPCKKVCKVWPNFKSPTTFVTLWPFISHYIPILIIANSPSPFLARQVPCATFLTLPELPPLTSWGTDGMECKATPVVSFWGGWVSSACGWVERAFQSCWSLVNISSLLFACGNWMKVIYCSKVLYAMKWVSLDDLESKVLRVPENSQCKFTLQFLSVRRCLKSEWCRLDRRRRNLFEFTKTICALYKHPRTHTNYPEI